MAGVQPFEFDWSWRYFMDYVKIPNLRGSLERCVTKAELLGESKLHVS